MFYQCLNSTPLTTQMANAYFADRIDGESWRGDVSFLATMRALLPGRMPEGAKVRLCFRSGSIDAVSIQEGNDESLIRDICRYLPEEDSISVHSFSCALPRAEANIELTKRSFASTFPGYELLPVVEHFFKPFGVDTVCFVNREKRSTVLFVSRMDLGRLHFLQTGMLIYFPWYFDKSAGCTEVEIRLIRSLKSESSDEYEAALDEAAKQFDFRSGFIRSSLNNFEKRRNERFLSDAESDLRSIDRDIETMMNSIGSRMMERESIQQRILGIQLRIDQSDGDSELMEYFIANKALSLESVRDDTISFVVNTYMEYFDPEAAERMINNQHSFVHDDYDNEEKIVEVLKAVFLSGTLRLRFCAAYRLRPTEVEAISGHEFDSVITDSAMPNPHIQNYACMGGYVREVNQALRKNDYVNAVEQCVASAKSLDWTDSAVMRRFMQGMCGNNFRCIELPDGSVVKPLEAYDWLQSQKEEAAHE